MILFAKAVILFNNPSVYYQLCGETECHGEIIKNLQPDTTGLITVTGGESLLEGIMLNIAFLFTVDFLQAI